MHCKDFLPLRVIGKVGNYVYDGNDDDDDDDNFVKKCKFIYFSGIEFFLQSCPIGSS